MSKADGEEERILGHTQLGEIFYKDCQYDSALYYFEKDFSRNHYTMLHCGKRIVEISKIKGDMDKIAHYAPLLAEATGKEINLAPQKAELVAIYEQHEAETHRAEIKYLWMRIVLAVAIVLMMLVAVFCVCSASRKKRHRNEIDKKDWYIGTLHGKIKINNAKNKSAEENIKSLEKKLESIKTPNPQRTLSVEKALHNIMDDELCKKLYATTQMHIKTTSDYPDLVLSDSEIVHIIELFDKELEGALSSIITKHPRLKQTDNLVFCLCLLGLDDKHIAAVTGNTYHNVYVRSQRCLEILGGGKDLREALSNALS